jgi:hypothetical protein
VDDVELPRTHPRQHALLAVLAKINVSVDVFGIAQMRDESYQGVIEIRFVALMVGAVVKVRGSDNSSDSFVPLFDDAVEVSLD